MYKKAAGMLYLLAQWIIDAKLSSISIGNYRQMRDESRFLIWGDSWLNGGTTG
jgi:hypothetical protein